MLNECNFIGRLGKDPETRFMPSGKAVANFSLAVGEKYKDKNTGQMVENTEWVRCSAFDRQAEIAAEYLKKGSLVHVKGRMKTRKWQDQSGQDKYSTEIMVDRFVMLGGDQKAADRQQNQGGQSQQSDQQQNQGLSQAGDGGKYGKSSNQQAGITQIDRFDDSEPPF